MSSTPAFRTVLRGYEPAQVDQRTAELIAEVRGRRDEALRLRQEVELLRDELVGRPDPEVPVPEPQAPPPSAFHELGVRVGRILTLAEEEADELVARARHDSSVVRAQAEAGARARRAEADRYDATVRGDARVEAERTVTAARVEADERVEAAHREAGARREEAEALWEDHRARAAAAAAEFEVTLANRRERAQEDFRARAEAAEDHLESVGRAADHARARAERESSDAREHVQRLLDDADAQGDRVVGEARERAERLRADSDRELAAASQRRASINAQIASVRQMLASMSGSVPVVGFETDDDDARAAAIEAAGLRGIDGQAVLGVDDGRDDEDGWDAGVADEHQDDHDVVMDLRGSGDDGGTVIDPVDGAESTAGAPDGAAVGPDTRP